MAIQSAVDRVSRTVQKLAGDHPTPVIAAIDGRSGAGKSTVAALVSAATRAAVIAGDSFYTGGPAARWDLMAPSAIVQRCVDWQRQRDVLSALREGREASWLPYDWTADDRRLARRPVTCCPQQIVLIEGVFSARPELADLLDLRILLETSPDCRRIRLIRRHGEEQRAELEARWAPAEEHYFQTVMPASEFDLIVRN